MTDELGELAGDDLARLEYEALPEAIKLLYGFVEYQWLGDAEKGRLVERECEPEQYVD